LPRPRNSYGFAPIRVNFLRHASCVTHTNHKGNAAADRAKAPEEAVDAIGANGAFVALLPGKEA